MVSWAVFNDSWRTWRSHGFGFRVAFRVQEQGPNDITVFLVLLGLSRLVAVSIAMEFPTAWARFRESRARVVQV